MKIETMCYADHAQVARATWLVNDGKTLAWMTFRADGSMLGNGTGGYVSAAEIEAARASIDFPALARTQKEQDTITIADYQRWLDDPTMTLSPRHSMWNGGISEATFHRLVAAAQEQGYITAGNWNAYCIQDGCSAGSWMIAPDSPLRM